MAELLLGVVGVLGVLGGTVGICGAGPGNVLLIPAESNCPSDVQMPPEAQDWLGNKRNCTSVSPSGSRKNIQAFSRPASGMTV